MSNIYIQEPPTSGKVLLKTSVGDIDIELWTREAPKACRNFIQLCMEGYYDGTIFHRLVKGFIVQGGDPNGDGTGGESIYGETFKDEFHSRLRFARRGLVAMANAGKDDNASQFFFTLAPCTELQNKHTIFGKVTGDTIYNMLKLEDGLVDENERPHYPQKIIRVDVLNNPFEDIVLRIVKVEKKEKKVHREKGVKNFGLLSFGDEAEEDEHETTVFVQKNSSKGKSTHDVLDDPKLSKDTHKPEQPIEQKRSETPDIENYSESEENEDEIKKKAARIKNKLKGASTKVKEQIVKKAKSSSDSDSDYLNAAENERKIIRKKKAEEIRNEIVTLKKEYSKDKKYKSELLNKERQKVEEKVSTNEMFKEYLNEKEKYSKLKELPKKGSSREQFTLSLLAKFKTKLETVKEKNQNDDETVVCDASAEEGEVNTKKRKLTSDKDDNGDNEENVDKEINSDAWLSHTLRFVERGSTLAKDASTKEDDWYDVYDPRNPINKRKREKKKENN